MTPSIDASATDLVRYVQHGLDRAVTESQDDWRLPILITANEGRVVVLRSVDSSLGTWTFYTDRRTPKVSQLEECHGEASATFYHQKDRTQLRLKGIVTPQIDAERQRLWSALSVQQKSSYACTSAPGSVVLEPTDGLSQSWVDGNPTTSEVDFAFANFAVYTFQVTSTELLLLHRQGHRRCTWEGWGGANFAWLVP